MEAFRLSRRKHAEPLSGKGAALKGARWNSAGVEAVYAASNRSLAMAEVAVHLTVATVPSDYVMVTLYLPDDISTAKLHHRDLPPNWNIFPHRPSTQAVGDRFIADRVHCVLQIPSAVTQGDYNLLINPYHSELSRIKIVGIEPFPFDARIFR